MRRKATTITLNPRSLLHQVAVHEAGHAVADLSLGLGCKIVTVRPTDEYRGQATMGASLHEWDAPDEGFSDHKWRKVLVSIYAGPMAQSMFANRPFSDLLSGTDLEHSFEIMLRLYSRWLPDPTTPGAFMQEVTARSEAAVQRSASKLLDRHWSAVVAIAGRLVVQRVMRGDQARVIFDHYAQAR